MAISTGQNVVASDFVSTSSGASDSGKVPKLNASGVLPLGFRPATFDTTQVYASAPVSATYVDLDLSAVVGTTKRVVMLRVETTGSNSVGIQFRKNGEASNYVNPNSGGAGTAGILFPGTPGFGYVIVVTDSSGIVEWRDVNANGVSVTVNVEAYW